MAAVFPERMNRLDPGDPTGSLSTIEEYIRYMTERMEFAMQNMTRSVNSAGVSSVEVMQAVTTLAGTVSVMSSTLSGISGEITAVNNRVTAVQGEISTLKSSVAALQEDLTKLTARVTALEGTGG